VALPTSAHDDLNFAKSINLGILTTSDKIKLPPTEG
jgi:hypothetical protein